MKNKKIVNIVCAFFLVQPLFDIMIYFFNNVLNLEVPFFSFIRPLFAIYLFIYLIIFNKQKLLRKKIYICYLLVYAFFCIGHILNIKDYFFELSYGRLTFEFRYLFNYGYYLLQFMNIDLIFKITDEEEKNKIFKSIVFAAIMMSSLYLISVITHTSPRTYYYTSIKDGWKGWSISSHYIGHSLTYLLPIVIYSIFEKKYYYNKFRHLIMLLVIVPGVYLVGTKASLFAQIIIVLTYTLFRFIFNIVKDKKINCDTLFFVILSVFLICTFKFTFGYANYTNQNKISQSTNDDKSELINSNLDINKSVSNIISYEFNENYKDSFQNRLTYVLYKNKDLSNNFFDNRSIQKIINKNLFKLNNMSDYLFGYGYNTMPNCTWVETDTWGIFYSYGIIGFILLILIPFGIVGFYGLHCLADLKRMTVAKLLFGISLALSLFIVTEVGYTMQFAQTVIYLVVLLIVSKYEFNKDNEISKNKKYLFAINDFCVGGAEVGLIDVANELAKTDTVDIVVLRKQGPLLEKLDKNIGVYEIINSNYSTLKKKLYHIMYFLGGIFTKYVYSRTIKYKYDVETAYIEGYPAVFVANSTNQESIKIASIRVGLKNHKLKADKVPLGRYHVKNAYKKMDKIYTVSKKTTDEFLECFPMCKGKISTIYTYFNVDEIKNKANEAMDYEYDKNYINFLAVGRFNEQKAYLRLIESFSQIYQKHKNIRLHMLGKYDTEYGNKVIKLIKQKKLNESVIIHGIKNNPYPYIKNCDCLISSSLYEGYPRVINEALALGKLCIGTNVTGTKEALLDGQMGLLVDDSIDGIVYGLTQVIENKKLFKKYEKAISKFDGNKKTFFSDFTNLCQKKKNMIIYMPKLSYGGMEKALVNLINYAKLNDDYNITLYLVYKGEMNYLGNVPKNIKVVVACPGKWNILGKIISTVKLIWRFIYHVLYKYDISISYSYQHPILCSLTRLASKNNIVYIHGNLELGISKKELDKRLKSCKYEKFNKIICVSHDSKQALSKLIGRKNKIYVINNAIDGDKILEMSQESIDDFKFEKNKIYLINICRHSDRYKKLNRILDATDRLNKEGYKFEVLFIGDGEDHKMYINHMIDLNLKNVHFLGKKSNPYKYLKKSDALILSSIREGYPVVFIESMVLKKPIITTNVSDAQEDIDGKYGIVVKNNDVSIYDGIKKFLDEKFEPIKEFDYKKFNKEIEEKTKKVYEEK